MVLRVVAVFVLAPILAAAIITTLLLAGADPHWVFLPGHALKAALASWGVHAPNALGVLATGVVWWGVVLVFWFAVRRIMRRRAG